MNTADFLLGLALGAPIGAGLLTATRAALALRTKANRDHYGHPWSPIDEVRRALPTPPLGHIWELRTEVSEEGHYMLNLALLNVSEGKDEASTKINLTYYQRHNSTWAELYRSFPSIAQQEFGRGIIGVAVDWATAQRANINSAPEDYELGT
ncbi:Uncharacterised protein [Mycolicibacterium fortuitum]|uniref:Uncharacterized protein n=1 Tax=Mycolicibacterium fortuitum TaxID=1766 RepID=A0A378WFK8_MYCFO|nr:Uncharacterised protein [Mycolicibacterium fortuitum]